MIGLMDDKVMEEASGLAYSKRQDGILWTHNDHGDDARVIAMSDEGQGPRQISELMGSKSFWEVEDYLIVVPFSVKI